MFRGVVTGLILIAGVAQAQRPAFDAFEVATIRPTDEKEQGRFIRMENDHRLLERGYSVKGLIAAAYDLNPKTISGEPGWANSEHYDIEAVTPGAVRPTHDEQMKMLRALLTERFKLTFHREKKDFSIYALEIAKGGPKLKAAADANAPATVGPGIAYPERIELPGRNATVGELASLLQRAILDRPVVDRTGLTGRYDFMLIWAPNDSEFGGAGPKASENAPSPPLFEALQQQLGLKLEATRGAVDALVVDGVERPSEN
jgi:uncharacterized protein (TIGR03435 family)